MRIERITQFKATDHSLKHGFSINVVENENAKYFDVNSRQTRHSGGWGKTKWLNLCSNFRLEFTYVV